MSPAFTPLPGGAGPAGPAGTPGNTMLTTSGVPANSVGVNGDYANDPAAQVIYGPKAAGAWPAGVSYQGAPGPAGPAGGAGSLVAVLDDTFATNTIASYQIESGSFAISGGVLVPQNTAAENTAIYSALVMNDFVITAKINVLAPDTGTVVAELYAAPVAFGSWVKCNFDLVSGAMDFYQLWGSVTALAIVTTGAWAPAANTSYWLRLQKIGPVFYAKAYTTDPDGGGSPAAVKTVRATGLAAATSAGIAFQVDATTKAVCDEFKIQIPVAPA